MKTTVEIADELFARTREVAQREGTTMRALIEEGLRATLARRDQKTSYRWSDLSVPGEGLSPEIEEGSWERLRDLLYTGRGT
jgi:Bacterial antitoxin of type II TA system, VapB